MKHLFVCGVGALAIGCAVPADEPRTKKWAQNLDGVCGSEPKQAPVGNSVRILSFNTELLSPWFTLPDVFTDQTNQRAAKIAEVVRRGKFDVIGFSEVWDENDGKDQLVEKLCPTYPHFVKSVDADTLAEELPEDSGLMVFSKLPFAALPNGAFVSGDSESSLGDNSPRIAFVKFDNCDDVDCLASKGAVMVRPTLASQRVLDFVVTHMQADGGNEATRTAQMRQIRGRCETGMVSAANLITTTLGLSLNPLAGLCAWPNTEWVAIAGDHNIEGEGAVRTSVHPGTATNAAGPPEWESQIGTFSDSVATNRWAIIDPVAETTAPLDIGFSHIHDTRLDYILTSRRTVTPPVTGPPPPEMCVQYTWNPPELWGISDHLPVAVDLNLMAAQCNPRLAYTLLPTDLNSSQVKSAKALPRAITFPGSMQWFRVTEPGTYSFAATSGVAGSSLAFEVFTDDNLSVPIGGAQNLGPDTILSCTGAAGTVVHCSEVPGTKFALTRPGFVRVFSRNRAFAGAYVFTAYKYTCKSPLEACAVLPHSPQPFSFPPGGTPLNADDAAWFQVDIKEQADSGLAQTLRFHADNTAPANWTTPSIQIWDSTASAQLAAIDGNAVSGQGSMLNPGGKQRVFRNSAATTNQRVFIRIRRTNVLQTLKFDVGWQTNLMLVGALAPQSATLVCEDETNPEIGEDEIRMRIRVDGVWRDGGFSSFECNSTPDAKGWSGKIGVIRALSDVLIRVIEEDDFLAGGDDVAGSVSVNFLPFESRIDGAGGHEIFWNFADGEYRFHFLGGKWRE